MAEMLCSILPPSLFFLFPSSAIVQQAQRSADGERVVYTTKVAKRHSVGLIVVWYALSNE